MDKQEFRDYIVFDVLADISGIHIKGLFGGYGFYLDDIIFGAYLNQGENTGGFYLKADKEFGAEIKEVGGFQFIYTGHKTRGPISMPYWYVPEEILEDREKITDWTYRAWEYSKTTKRNK